MSIENPLQTAVDIATATDGDPARFAQFIAPYTRSGGTYDSVSLWKITNGTPAIVESSGATAATPDPSAAAAIIRASRSTSFDVASVSSSVGQLHIGYALASTSSSFAVYAERPIPANRRVQIESTSAFADLHFATYLGRGTDMANLQTTDRPPNQLPLRGNTDQEAIPFGDTTLTLVTSPIGHLGGALGYQLPWILLVAGALLSAFTTAVVGQLVRRRRDAERDAHTITGLYDRLDALFGEQRTISETLQHALLPQVNPNIPALEIGSRYLAGVRGVDIGGDWYSIIHLNDTHFGFVVGDVSGRGVEAAALMARIRFTLRAYLFEGHPPSAALDLCARQIDINVDLHFATVLVGLGDLSRANHHLRQRRPSRPPAAHRRRRQLHRDRGRTAAGRAGLGHLSVHHRLGAAGIDPDRVHRRIDRAPRRGPRRRTGAAGSRRPAPRSHRIAPSSRGSPRC